MYYRAPERPPAAETSAAAAPAEGLRDHLSVMWNPSARDQPPEPRRIGTILRGRGPSGALAEKARTLVRVERAVHGILGEKSAPHVRAGKLSGSSLTLTADTPAWASIARFRAPDIRAAVRSELPRLREVRVIVRETESPVAPAHATEHRPLSPFAARVLRSVARTLDNPRLARSLIRLAARERPPAGSASASDA